MVRVPTTAPAAFSLIAVAERAMAVGASLISVTVTVKAWEVVSPPESVVVTVTA